MQKHNLQQEQQDCVFRCESWKLTIHKKGDINVKSERCSERQINESFRLGHKTSATCALNYVCVWVKTARKTRCPLIWHKMSGHLKEGPSLSWDWCVGGSLLCSNVVSPFFGLLPFSFSVLSAGVLTFSVGADRPRSRNTSTSLLIQTQWYSLLHCIVYTIALDCICCNWDWHYFVQHRIVFWILEAFALQPGS